MKKIVIITGLTASGKSGLALKTALKHNGEIISADSVQIYKGLDIGSAKDLDALKQVKHHLIDIKNFNETYNVGEFLLDVEKAIKDCFDRDKLPIIVGGTGLYIKALLEGYSLGGVETDFELRQYYENMAKDKGNIAVWDELNSLDENLASRVHFNNLKRVIRYIDIAKNGNKYSEKKYILEGLDVLSLGIVADREQIYKRIDNRVDEMLADGLENEVRSLVSQGVNRDSQSMNSIGYKEWFDYFQNKQTKEKTIELIKQHSRNYCKRQLTFLKTINGLKLVNINDAEKEIEEFLNDRD